MTRAPTTRRTADPSRPGPTRLDHVAIAVREASRAAPFLVGTLGGRSHEAGPGLEGFHWWQYRFEGGGLLEVLEPRGPESGFLHRFLDARGAGIHHVTFKVPDLRAAADRAASFGYQIHGYFDEHPAWKEAFLHPKQAQGIVVQLAESHPELESGDPSAAPFPPAPAPASPPARLVGLRLAAASAEAARRQWAELLGGTCTGGSGKLAFRWPGAPLRIAVEVDPGGEEGVRCLEVAAPRWLDLPDGPHPVLGARFVPVEHPRVGVAAGA